MTRTCAVCKRTFETSSGIARICSAECYGKTNRRTFVKMNGYAHAEPFRCKWCGEYVEPDGKEIDHRFEFCSSRCSHKYHKKPRHGTGYHVVTRG